MFYSLCFLFFYALCTIYFFSILHFMPFFIFAHLSILLFLSLLLCSLELLFFLFLRYLITNLNPKKLFNGTWTIWLLSLALWSNGLFLGLRIRSLGLPWRPYDLIWLFCLELLRFTSRYWVACLFLCAGFLWLHSWFGNLEFTRI